MHKTDTISYNTIDTHEYEFSDFIVHLQVETQEIAVIRFKNKSDAFIKSPAGICLRGENSLTRSANEFRICWHGRYTLELNETPILEIYCPRQQVIRSNFGARTEK